MKGEVAILRKGETSALQVLENLLEKAKREGEAGAVAVFIGLVRGFTSKGEPVEGLSYEAYEEVAIPALQRIRSEALSKPGIVEVLIYHVVDDLKVGDEIVYVAVAGKHRKETFQTLTELVEKVKFEVPIFKKEKLKNGRAYWVSEVEAEKGKEKV
ncbi:molybdenum cofactor biosynthesis protein MoaE [Candidatus Bathyarchaeota archaeon]|nr:MAG: molybdenum cofactor biosynthesis protein MoaE [Candidatus Bathyarchaeota archaeon]